MFIAIVFIIAIASICIMENYTKRVTKMAEQGYCETPVLGSHNLLWQKCPKEAKNEN